MVGKEDGERKRWKGKPGIKESLRVGSSVLTLSQWISRTTRVVDLDTIDGLEDSFFFFFNDEEKTRGESQEDFS